MKMRKASERNGESFFSSSSCLHNLCVHENYFFFRGGGFKLHKN